MIGGVKQARVIWGKGSDLRRGFVYDVWDFKNYIYVKVLKKKDLAQIHQENMDIHNGVRKGSLKWPDPLAIPFGKPILNGRIIYFSYPWSLRIRRMLIPNWVIIRNRFWSIRMAECYFINKVVKDKPGVPDLQVVSKRPEFKAYDPKMPALKMITHYENARLMVRKAVASNPEINQEDFTAGSIPIIGKTQKEFVDD
jgi:hypothetical protein